MTSEGKTVFEAIRLVNLKLPRKPFWSHAFIIILSEEIAQKDLLSHLDFFRRDHEIRQDMVVIITENPDQLLRTAPDVELGLGHQLKYTTKGGANFTGVPVFSTLHEITKMLYSKSPYAAISHVTVDEKEKKYRVDGISFFRKDRMVGTIKGTNTSGWQWITGGVRSAIIPLPCNKPKKRANGKLSVEINKTTSKLEVIEEKGKLTLKVKIKAKSNVGENGCGVDLSKEETFKQVEKLASNEIKKFIEHMLEYSQKTIKTDIFGFGSAYYQKYPKSWKAKKNDWNELYSKAKREVEVDVKIIGSGLIFTEKIGE
jgi:spore germination protein KC